MPAKQDQKLSKLLYLQQAGDLSEKERNELEKLMQIDRSFTLKKAFALREATKRGLTDKLNQT